MPEPLDFAAERDEGTDSWKRADPHAALIERLNVYGWRIWLPDSSGDPHDVALAVDNGAYVGRCDCKGFQYSGGPCAHLCTLRKAAFIDAETTRGQVVQIADVEDDRDQALADRVDGEPAVATDGGGRR